MQNTLSTPFVESTSFAQFRDYLKSRLMFGMKAGLENMERALTKLGHPELKYPCIHVAGTNGKGSTAYFLSQMLCAQGLKVGLYTSPHLLSLRERIRVNHIPITESRCAEVGAQIMRDCHHDHDGLTYFEVMTVSAFLYFAQEKVDVAILEVGLGGRLDATNIVPNELAVLTSIGFDHTHILGNTLPEILHEKLGVWKAGQMLVCGALPEELLKLIQERGTKQNSPYLLWDDHQHHDLLGWNAHQVELPQQGEHLKRNYTLAALAAHTWLKAKSITPLLSPQSPSHWKWPGRMQMLYGAQNELHYILDGAHNPQGIEAFIQTYHHQFKDKGIRTIALSVLADKDYSTMLPLIDELGLEVILTRSSHKNALEPQRMAECFANSSYRIIEDGKEFLHQLPEFSKPMICVGSLYFMGDLIEILKHHYHELEEFRTLSPDTNEWK